MWDQFSLITINYDFNNLIITVFLIVSKVVVKFRYEVGIRDLKHGHAE